MGRGRQKAKQAKIARDLKYMSPATDFTALQRELSGKSHDSASWDRDDDDDDRHPHDRWADDDD